MTRCKASLVFVCMIVFCHEPRRVKTVVKTVVKTRLNTDFDSFLQVKSCCKALRLRTLGKLFSL